jgi:hypothetical protein
MHCLAPSKRIVALRTLGINSRIHAAIRPLACPAEHVLKSRLHDPKTGAGMGVVLEPKVIGLAVGARGSRLGLDLSVTTRGRARQRAEQLGAGMNLKRAVTASRCAAAKQANEHAHRQAAGIRRQWVPRLHSSAIRHNRKETPVRLILQATAERAPAATKFYRPHAALCLEPPSKLAGRYTERYR